MESLFKQISISKLARYAYPGFLALLIVYINKIDPIWEKINDKNIILILSFALTFGTTFYIFYRYIIGEYILYAFTNAIHLLFRRSTSPIEYLKKFTYNGPESIRNYWTIYWKGRKAYNYLRRFYFKKEDAARLDFYHTEIYLLYVTFVIGVFYWFFILFIPDDGELSFNKTYTLAIVGTVTLLFWICAIIIDIQQHEMECRWLTHSKDQKELEKFLVEYGLADKLDYNQITGNLAEPLNRLQYLCDTIPSLVKQIPEEEFSCKPAPNKWSKKEILGHLIDSATNNHQRFVRGQFEDTPFIVYDQNNWVACSRYQDMESAHVIAFWEAYHRHLLEVIKRIPEESLSNKCKTNEPEPVTLQWLIEDYVVHQEHHLRQIMQY